jgi:hypothetical protein
MIGGTKFLLLIFLFLNMGFSGLAQSTALEKAEDALKKGDAAALAQMWAEKGELTIDKRKQGVNAAEVKARLQEFFNGPPANFARSHTGGSNAPFMIVTFEIGNQRYRTLLRMERDKITFLEITRQ